MSSRRAFTLIELMVVILIIAVVIAIVIPAVGSARDAAKKTDTLGLLSRLGMAAGSFETDHRRQPGHWAPHEMGDAANAARGMSAMENLMIDVLGGIPKAGPGDPTVEIGPVAANPLYQIAMTNFGIASGDTRAYFTPDPKHYVAQIGGTVVNGAGQICDVALGHGRPSDTDPLQFKDLVDAWGNPIVVFQRDDRAIQPINAENDFVATNTTPGAPKAARYYWQSNACFLESKALGRKGYDQSNPTRGSFLNQAAGGGAAGVATSLMGVLGSPGGSKVVAAMPSGSIYLPTAGRAAFFFQSAGADGIFLSKKDRGARQFAAALMDFGVNVAPDPTGAVGPANQYTDPNGKPTSNDLLKNFDDVTHTAGN